MNRARKERSLSRELPWLLLCSALMSCALDAGDGANTCTEFAPGSYEVVAQTQLGPDFGCSFLPSQIELDPNDTLHTCMGFVNQRGCDVNAEIDCVLGHGVSTLRIVDLRFNETTQTFDGTLEEKTGNSPEFENPSCHTNFEVSLRRLFFL